MKSHVDQVIDENHPDEGKDVKVCASDPDETLAISSSMKKFSLLTPPESIESGNRRTG